MLSIKDFLGDAFVWMLTGLRDLFSTWTGYFVAKAMGFIGVTLATTSFVIGPLLDQVAGLVSGLGGGAMVGVALDWLGFVRVDICITMLLSAHGMGFVSDQLRTFFKKVV